VGAQKLGFDRAASPPQGGLESTLHSVAISHKRGRGDGRSAFESYLCSRCGFMEMYAVLSDPDFAPMDQDRNWQKV
jgi:hypothetical protein